MYIPQGAVAFFTDLGGRTTVVSLKHSGPNQRSFSLRASIFPLSRVRAHLAFPIKGYVGSHIDLVLYLAGTLSCFRKVLWMQEVRGPFELAFLPCGINRQALLRVTCLLRLLPPGHLN